MPLLVVWRYMDSNRTLTPTSSRKLTDVALENNGTIMPLMTNEQRSLLVTFSAKALSSFGFGVSILAIWLTWLFPTALAGTEPVVVHTNPIQKKKRRKSAPATLRKDRPALVIRRTSTPVTLNPIYISRPEATSPMSASSKRVYFADSPRHPARPSTARSDTQETQGTVSDAYATPPPTPPTSSPLLPETAPCSPVTQVQPPSTSIETSGTQTVEPEPITNRCNTYPESGAESDSSRQSSAQPPTPTLLKSVLTKARRSLDSNSTSSSSSAWSVVPHAEDPAQPNAPSKKSGKPWSINRSRPTTQTTCEVASTKSPTTTSRLPFTRRPATAPGNSNSSPTDSTKESTSSFHPIHSISNSFKSSPFMRKNSRRGSTPVPRTQPYGAPYFAEPPIADDSYVRLRLAEIAEDKGFNSDHPVEAEEARGRRLQEVNAEAQSQLGHGRRPIHKRRSASAGWAQGRASTL
ncbi:hypothetical protein BDN72DRAFT_953900 [Pluteus cervinus]|uniref:Uncharacterized protein n=1 Tax=Pluteus cervinus TaxID=181527 RepID=A0ACD3BJR3_9AGAR|nr:hypothetical protein BDN72DRAFT_953900 [Pluteus cervinus]